MLTTRLSAIRSRALIVAAASSPPLGQDLSELFALYAPPKTACTPLAANEAPQRLNVMKARGEVHRDGDWHRSVHIWLVDTEGRLVLQRRSKFKDTHPGLLDVSCAGHITGADGVLETSVRELEEELGLSVRSVLSIPGCCGLWPAHLQPVLVR